MLGGSYESLAGFFRYFETDRSMPVEWKPSAKRPQPAKTAIKMALRYKVLNAYAKRLEERKAPAAARCERGGDGSHSGQRAARPPPGVEAMGALSITRGEVT